MDKLEIKIVLSYKIPEKGLTLNGILRGLQEDQNKLMRNMVKAIPAAMEKKTIKEHISRHPGRYYRHGKQSRKRKLITSFGPIHYRLAQLYERRTGSVFPPLIQKLSILSHKQYQREALEAAVGQCVRELAEGYGQWPCLKHRNFKFLMADGTKVKRQGPSGAPLDQAEMR